MRCYHCGGPVSGGGVRRWVRVAQRTFVSFGLRGRPRFGGGGTTAPRTLCHGCAASMDKASGVTALIVIVVAGGIILWGNLAPEPERVVVSREISHVTTEENLGLDPAAPWPPPVVAAKKHVPHTVESSR